MLIYFIVHISFPAGLFFFQLTLRIWHLSCFSHLSITLFPEVLFSAAVCYQICYLHALLQSCCSLLAYNTEACNKLFSLQTGIFFCFIHNVFAVMCRWCVLHVVCTVRSALLLIATPNELHVILLTWKWGAHCLHFTSTYCTLVLPLRSVVTQLYPCTVPLQLDQLDCVLWVQSCERINSAYMGLQNGVDVLRMCFTSHVLRCESSNPDPKFAWKSRLMQGQPHQIVFVLSTFVKLKCVACLMWVRACAFLGK